MNVEDNCMRETLRMFPLLLEEVVKGGKVATSVGVGGILVVVARDRAARDIEEFIIEQGRDTTEYSKEDFLDHKKRTLEDLGNRGNRSEN